MLFPLAKIKEDDNNKQPRGGGAGRGAPEGGELHQEEIQQAEARGKLNQAKLSKHHFCSQVEDFLADQNVQESGKFEDFGGLQLLNDHVENIRVEWNCNTPRVFANASKRFLFYKHLGMGILNDEEEDDDDEEEDNEEESPACNLMVLPNAELCGLWSVLLFCEL